MGQIKEIPNRATSLPATRLANALVDAGYHNFEVEASTSGRVRVTFDISDSDRLSDLLALART